MLQAGLFECLHSHGHESAVCHNDQCIQGKPKPYNPKSGQVAVRHYDKDQEEIRAYEQKAAYAL